MSDEIATAEEQMQAYTEAVKSGLYAKKSGLVGKYDNVRRYWEDEVTRIQIRPHLDKLVGMTRERMRRLRVLDLGCGSADGYELLSGVRLRDPGLEQNEVDLLTPEILGAYKGTDLNEDLLDQARGIYGANPKMRFVWDSVVTEVLGEQTVTGVRVRNVKTGETSVIEADGVFVYIGMIPGTKLFVGQVEMDEQGYIITDQHQRTNVPGVFAAGDVQNPNFRQIVVAAGSGAVAAIQADRFLADESGSN